MYNPIGISSYPSVNVYIYMAMASIAILTQPECIINNPITNKDLKFMEGIQNMLITVL